MRTLKDIQELMNNSRPLTDEERSYRLRKAKMRAKTKRLLLLANERFKDKETIQKPLFS